MKKYKKKIGAQLSLPHVNSEMGHVKSNDRASIRRDYVHVPCIQVRSILHKEWEALLHLHNSNYVNASRSMMYNTNRSIVFYR